jgi:23S rRNA pseudouridine1911/1915/1917 synthase
LNTDLNEILVTESMLGGKVAERLDRVVAHLFPEVSVRQAKQLCLRGEVILNGRKSSPGSTVSAGDRVQLSLSSLRQVKADPERVEFDLKILYEDEQLMVVAKPRMLHSVRLRLEDLCTLADMISKYYPPAVRVAPDPREAGLVNRLDFETSGCALVAKDRAIWEALREELFQRHVQKQYLALVEGMLPQPELEISNWLSPRGVPVKFSTSFKNQWLPSRTSLRQECLIGTSVRSEKGVNRNPISLVRASIPRARRHQVRIHLSAIGCSLVGDELYGAKTTLSDQLDAKLIDEFQLEKGFLLHASSVSFQHPVTQAIISVTDPSLDALFERLREVR